MWWSSPLAAVVLLLPGSEEPIHYSPGLKEPLFAYLYGLLDTNMFGTRTTEDFRLAVEGAGRPSRIPYQRIASLTREPAPDKDQALITVRFAGPFDMPIPYKLIIYRPGNVKASEEVTAREWHVGTLAVASPTEPVVLNDLHVFAVTGGYAAVDFDAWLDSLLGKLLDDTHVSGIATFRWNGVPYGIAVGYNRDGKGSSGALDMTSNEVIVRRNPPLKAVGRFIRHWLEAKGFGFSLPPIWQDTASTEDD
jgi:hypothetical protein